MKNAEIQYCRMLLYAKDIMSMTGKSERTVRRIIAGIRQSKNATIKGAVSIEEFSEYSGISEERIMAFVNYNY